MSVATSTAIAIGAGVSAAGAIGGAALGSRAANKAATTQANAADQAAQIQATEADKALDFQKQEFSTEQQNLAPWLTAGKQGLSSLSSQLSTPGAGLLTPFTPPTAAEAEAYPGYKFGLQQGEGALQNSAAAKGNLISGNTQEALSKYAQDYAQNDYSNVYNQAFNTFETNQTNSYNRLAQLAGLGQTSATTLGQEGQAAAQNEGNIDINLGAEQGQDVQNAAAATASGYVGSANAWGGALGNSTNSLLNLALLGKLYGNQNSGNPIVTEADLPSYASITQPGY